MSQHTPGPWTIWDNTDNIPAPVHLLIKDANGIKVAEILDLGHDRGAENHEDNARLIAAAPELLILVAQYREMVMEQRAEQEMFADFINSHENDGIKVKDWDRTRPNPFDATLREIDLVIAKATGESHA